VGTGLFLGAVGHLARLSALAFSRDGRYLAVGTHAGLIWIWQLNKELVMNIEVVVRRVACEPNFWDRYPIYLTIYQTSSQFFQLPGLQISEEREEREVPGDYTPLHSRATAHQGEERGDYPPLHSR